MSAILFIPHSFLVEHIKFILHGTKVYHLLIKEERNLKQFSSSRVQVVREDHWDEVFYVHPFLENSVIVQAKKVVLLGLWNQLHFNHKLFLVPVQELLELEGDKLQIFV
jgi:hypothetical protein